MKGAALTVAVLAGLAGGFLVGFLWGQGTRSSVSDATQTDFSGGVLTVRVDTLQAAKSGLASLLH